MSSGTATPSGEIKSPPQWNYEGPLKEFAGELSKLTEWAEKSYKILLEEQEARKADEGKKEEVRKKLEEARKSHKEEPDEAPDEDEQEEAKKAEAFRLAKPLKAAKLKAEEEEAKKAEVKAKLEELSKKIEEAKAKLAEAKSKREEGGVKMEAGGKGAVGDLQAGTEVPTAGQEDLPNYFPELLKAYSKFKGMNMLPTE